MSVSGEDEPSSMSLVVVGNRGAVRIADGWMSTSTPEGFSDVGEGEEEEEARTFGTLKT